MNVPVEKLESHSDENGRYMTVHTADDVAQFAHVITTTTLPCLDHMDLSGAGLDVEQAAAITALVYTPAVKIGVKFQDAWWQDDALMKRFGAFGKIVGGQSSTDRQIRRVVYPSQGAGGRPSSTVLTACYATYADAQPWAKPVDTQPSAQRADPAELKRVVIDDLVAVHGFGDDGRRYLEETWQNAVMHHWGDDPYTRGHCLSDCQCPPNLLTFVPPGAWASFYPGQFEILYATLTRPGAGGLLHFAGEGVSAWHGFVSTS